MQRTSEISRVLILSTCEDCMILASVIQTQHQMDRQMERLLANTVLCIANNVWCCKKSS